MPDSHHATGEVPILETPRLKLRGHRLDDFSHSAAMWADSKVTQYAGGQPLSEQESWTRFLRYIGHWHLLGFGYWVVEEKETGRFVGEIGFADYKRDLEPSLAGMPEIGWVLASSFHGRGFATEAVRAAVAWGDVHFPSRRTACIIAPQNLASIRVAEKCGYQGPHPATYKGKPTLLYFREPAAAK